MSAHRAARTLSICGEVARIRSGLDFTPDSIRNSTVVIWGVHIGSYGNRAPLLGKYLRKDLVNRGTLG